MQYRLCLVGFWQVVETYPAISILDSLKLFFNLFFAVTRTLYNLPKSQKFIQSYCAIMVDINLIEEFLSWDFCKTSFPVLDGFFFVDCLVAIQVKAIEGFVNFGI